MRLLCPRGHEEYPVESFAWRCGCGEPLILDGAPPFRPADVDEPVRSLWRYAGMLPLPRPEMPVTLGEGWTPLLQADVGGFSVHCKMESLNPTGSFKDRGLSVLVTALRAAGVGRVVEDSSGNAGASLAGYAARAGLRAMIYAPAAAPPAKLQQVRAYGAELLPIPGPRAAVAKAAQSAIGPGTVYASHVYQPLALGGIKTLAYELWEQLGGRAPDFVIVPVGHGTCLLGLAAGFEDLQAAGLIAQPPRLIGVQPAACAPLAAAFAAHSAEPVWVSPAPTVADGAQIAQPVRGEAVLAAVRHSGGTLLAIPDEVTVLATQELARAGLYVEPTSALTAAALPSLAEVITTQAVTVLVLTGHGLKRPSG